MTGFPGGSRSRVNTAGRNVRNGCAHRDDWCVIDEWRAAHRGVLNTFQAILRTRTRGSKTVVAQRHKRRSTIVGKLKRFPGMQLSRMDDVAGCRLIFPTVASLYKFRESLHKARFKHRVKNRKNKYDYIQNPKTTGYRGVHDVYSYDVNSIAGRDLRGLLVEVQYRTEIQHAWATAVEVIGFITQSQPKFQEGDKRYESAMAWAAEILARAFEGVTGPYPEYMDAEVVRHFLDREQELGLLHMLRGLNLADAEVSQNRNTILIFTEQGELEVRTYRDSTDALRALFELEEEKGREDIVLVKADSSEEMRFAFKNYFSDARDFVDLVERGCEQLAGVHVAGGGTRNAPA